MRVKLQLVMCNDKGDEETVTDLITLNKNNQRIEHLGLTLAESKQLLSTLQRHLLQQQVNTFLDTCSDCPDCGTPLHLKARSRRSFRTLFGTFQFDSPRLEHCDCTRQDRILSPPGGPVECVSCPGAPVYGSQVVFSGVLWYEPGCPPGLLAA